MAALVVLLGRAKSLLFGVTGGVNGRIALPVEAILGFDAWLTEWASST